MARNGHYSRNEQSMESTIESPADEEGVHDSFTQLIEEQEGQNEDYPLMDIRPHLDPEEEEEGRDDVGYLPSPLEGPHGDELEEGSASEPLTPERWSSATLRVLSSMPSRTIGRSRGAIISQYYNRTMLLRRRRQSRPSIKDFSRSARPSIRGYGVEIDSADFKEEESKRDRLVNNLQNLSVSDRVRMLKDMPLSMAEKRELRQLVSRSKVSRSFSHRQIPCCTQLKYHIIIALRHSWYSWLSFLHSLQLWQVALKRVGGRFGTSVLSYFLFLKTLVFFNLFLFLLIGLFLVLPQAVHPPRPATLSTAPTGLELLTGAGYFTNSVMYYGYYTNFTLNRWCHSNQNHTSSNRTGSNRTLCEEGPVSSLSYNMPLAYFFIIGVAFFITCIILVYSMSKSFGLSFRVSTTHGILAMKVFSSWDFKVIKKSSVRLQAENISTRIKELLSDVNRKSVETSVLQLLGRQCVHLLAWTMCVGSTVACVLAVHFFSVFMHQDHQAHVQSPNQRPLLREASLLALPVVVSVINLLLPGFFNAVAWMEEYDSPSVRTHVDIFRNLMLKVSVLCVLCYHWLGRIASNPQSLGLQCWETFVGQELYRFLLMDFIFSLLNTFFGEFLWRLFSLKVLKRKRKPGFDIARNVLDLIYGQTLAWLGVLFSPLLPAVQIIKLVLLFYIKKTSLMMNCQSPRKPWRASQMTTLFITLLCFPSFLGASVCVTYTMWSIQPSVSCGPFRSLSTMFQSGKLWVKSLERNNPSLGWLVWVHTYLVENPFCLFLAAAIFLIVIYFNMQVVDGQRKVINLLQEQIENEGEDKKFLITKLQDIHERKRPFSSRRIRTSEESSL